MLHYGQKTNKFKKIQKKIFKRVSLHVSKAAIVVRPAKHDSAKSLSGYSSPAIAVLPKMRFFLDFWFPAIAGAGYSRKFFLAGKIFFLAGKRRFSAIFRLFALSGMGMGFDTME